MTNQKEHDILNSIPNKPVDSIPVESKLQVLPFNELTWENFEKICYQLGLKKLKTSKGTVVDGYIYGSKGQKQEGIDIWFEEDNIKEFWQIKKYKKFTDKDVKKAAEKFLNGNLVNEAKKFVICVSDYLDDIKVVNEISIQKKLFKEKNIDFEVLNSDKLTMHVKEYPELIISFFSENWAYAIGINRTEPNNSKTTWTCKGERLENDKIYQHGIFNFQVNDDGTVDTEYQLPTGEVAYHKTNLKNGKAIVSHVITPHPISEYSIEIPKNLIVNQQDMYTTINKKKYLVKVFNLKWSKKITVLYDENDKIMNIDTNAKHFRDDINKVYKFLSEDDYNKLISMNS